MATPGLFFVRGAETCRAPERFARETRQEPVMTHQPPIPEAATSPYPLHPAPIPEEVKQLHEMEAAAKVEEPETGVSPAALGIGTAIAVGAAAAVTGLLYARRRATSSSKAPAETKRGGDNKASVVPRIAGAWPPASPMK